MVLETSQLLIGVVVLLTFLSLAIGYQVFVTLRDVRRTLAKANQVIDEADEVLEDISFPIKNFSATLMTLQTTGNILNYLFGDKKRRQITKEISGHGKEVFTRIEELARDESMDTQNNVGNSGEDKIESTAPSAPVSSPVSFLSATSRRLFKGIPKRR